MADLKQAFFCCVPGGPFRIRNLKQASKVLQIMVDLKRELFCCVSGGPFRIQNLKKAYKLDLYFDFDLDLLLRFGFVFGTHRL